MKHSRNNGLMIYENGEYKAYQQFLDGDLRVDGWRSEWRKDFEAYRENKKSLLKSIELKVAA